MDQYTQHGPALLEKPAFAHADDSVRYDDASWDVPQHTNSKRLFPLLAETLRWWGLEITACFVSVVAILVQVVVLYRFDGQTQDGWPSTTLTLNGFIALLATLCRSSLMVSVAAVLGQLKWSGNGDRRKGNHNLTEYQLLDEASRGTLGSVQVLWKYKGIFHFGCMGALITIASLALSTFTQQIISVQTVMMPSTDAAITDKTGAAQWTNVPNVKVSILDQRGGLTLPIKLASIEGLMAPKISSLPVACPTGNCTWPDFTTLGVCGNCVNVTSDIRRTQEYDFYTLPNGMGVGISMNPASYLPFRKLLFTANNTSTGRPFESESNSTDRKIDSRLILAEFTMLAYENPRSAFECGIWLCLQSRRVKIANGEQTDEILDTWVKTNLTGDSMFTDVPLSVFVIPTNASFQVSRETAILLREFLYPMFIGTANSKITEPVPLFSSDYAQALYKQLEDPHAWIDRLAESMTNGLRGAGPLVRNPTDQPHSYQGVPFVTQVIVVVRWRWLVYPATLVLLSIVYLSLEITRTMRSGTRPWKSDPLVPLYASLDLDRNVLAAAGAGLDKPSGLRSQLGDLSVRLEVGDEHGVRFSGRMPAEEQTKDRNKGYGRIEGIALGGVTSN